jgi:hypothetical protein
MDDWWHFHDKLEAARREKWPPGVYEVAVLRAAFLRFALSVKHVQDLKVSTETNRVLVAEDIVSRTAAEKIEEEYEEAKLHLGDHYGVGGADFDHIKIFNIVFYLTILDQI